MENADGRQTVNHEDFRILGLAGSLRRASFHRGILRAAHEVGPEWMSCESFDLGRIPYFNQDIEDEGIPEPVEELREKIRTHDAVLIATPEYDYAVPGVLPAARDWALRSPYDPTPFRHKPVAIVGAGPGGGAPPGDRWCCGRYSCMRRPTLCPSRRCSSPSRARSSTRRPATS